jgi:peptidyl-prolyl cis-trans isomerase C
VRCHDGKAAERLCARARELSNCPSGAEGGELGWLVPGDCAPEFARELFGQAIGVLPRLVHSRFGLHVVEVLAREPARAPLSRPCVRRRLALQQQTLVTALQQYLRILAGAGGLEGVALEGSDTPLVQ